MSAAAKPKLGPARPNSAGALSAAAASSASSSSSSSSSSSAAGGKKVQMLSFEHPGLAITPRVNPSAVTNAKRKARDEKRKSHVAATAAAISGGGGGVSANAASAGAGGPTKKVKIEKAIVQKMERLNAERGPELKLKSVKDRKLKSRLEKGEKRFKTGVEKAARAEILLPSDVGYLQAEGMEKTFQYSQNELKQNVDIRTAKKMYTYTGRLGPYMLDYTRGGRHLLLGGRKGQLALLDWQKQKLMFEVQLKETIRDVKFLHNEQFVAVAQKRYVFVYDQSGAEVHCLRDMVDVNVIDYLPYHFLMVTVNKSGILKYRDTTDGHIVAEHKTRLGDCSVMTHNPFNAVVCCGHNDGIVSMWTPNHTGPVVRIKAHAGPPITALAVDRGGWHIATSAGDSTVRVWDIRTYKQVHEYFSYTPAVSLSISELGMLAVGERKRVTVWRDALRTKAKSPYLAEQFNGRMVERVRFVPYEDFLGVSTDVGFTSLLVPGAGEPNFDTNEAIPFQTKAQRREDLPQKLLDKLQPDMITLDPNAIGRVDDATIDIKINEKKEAMSEKKAAAAAAPKVEKNKMRGKNSSGKRHRKKKTNIVDAKTEEREQLKRMAAAARTDAKEERKRQSELLGGAGGGKPKSAAASTAATATAAAAYAAGGGDGGAAGLGSAMPLPPAALSRFKKKL